MSLPKQWTSAPVLSICKARMGQTILAKDLSVTGLPVFSAGGSGAPWGYTKMPVEQFGTTTIVLSARGSIGNPRLPGLSAFTSTQTTIAATCALGIEPRYLTYAFRSLPWEEIASGAAIPMLTISRLAEQSIPLAPEGEQRRIADKLDTVLTRVDAVNTRLARVASLLKRFRQSVLAAATSGRLTEDWRNADGAADWISRSVDSLCSHISDGPFGSNLKSDDYTDDGARVVRLENIGHLNFDATKKTFIAIEKYETLRKHTLLQGDLLFSSFVDEEVRVCEFPSGIVEPAINKADCFCVRADPMQVNRRFLAMRLACKSTYEELKELVHGATRPRINLRQLRNFEVMLPSLNEQVEIVRRVETLFAFADRLEARLQVAQTAADRLTPSLLAKAFRGELVPQDPNDEPAADLLRRLQADVGDKVKSKK